MARLGSACALLGLLFIPFSVGCSNSGTQGLPLSVGNPGGTGNTVTDNHGTGGALAYVAQSTAAVLSTSVLANLLKSCGNSVIDANEQCDDGNTYGGDGCSKTCQLENPNEWDCPKPRGPGVSIARRMWGRQTQQPRSLRRRQY